MRKLLTLVIAVLLTEQIGMFGVAAKEPVNIYVSEKGSITGSGEINDPVNSIQSAILLCEKFSGEDINILFDAGEYQICDTAVFNGFDKNNVTFKANGDKDVIFTGAVRLNSQKFSNVSDASILKRIPREARSKVLQYNLSESGVKYSLSDSKRPYLFVNGNMQTKARYPNNEHLTAKTADGTTSFEVLDYDVSKWNRAKDTVLVGSVLSTYFWRNCNISVSEKNITSDTKIRKDAEYFVENLIEEFMIEANKVVATLAFQNAYPFLYRGHRIPERSLMVEVSKFMSKLGISLPYSLEKSYMDPKVFQQSLKWCKSSSYYPIIEEMLLHTMRKAEYYAFPIGHYGLAIDQGEFYTHFTSPIRRFPDLCVHQLIKDFVLGDLFYKNEEVQNHILSLKNKLPFIASVASHAETRALEIERYMEKQTMRKYIQYKIGSTVSGSIIKIEERGITLLIDDLYHILIPSYTIYGYIMDSNQLFFQCPHGVYYLMDELEVKITSVSRTAMVYGVISKENKQRKTPKVYQKY